jgi:hypothetical protein
MQQKTLSQFQLSAKLPEVRFFRGNQFVADSKNNLRWFLNADNEFRNTRGNQSSDAIVLPFCLSARYGTDEREIEKLTKDLATSKTARKAAQDHVLHALGQMHNAFYIMDKYPTLFGIGSHSLLRFGPSQQKQFLHGWVSSNAKKLEDIPKNKYQVVLNIPDVTPILNEAEFEETKKKLIANRQFAQIMRLLASEDIPVSIFGHSPQNMDICSLQLGSGLVLNSNFIDALCGEESERSVSAKKALYSEAALLVILKRARTLADLGLCNSADYLELQKEFYEYIGYEELSPEDKIAYDRNGILAILHDMLSQINMDGHAESEAAAVAKTYPKMAEVIGKIAAELNYEMTGKRQDEQVKPVPEKSGSATLPQVKQTISKPFNKYEWASSRKPYTQYQDERALIKAAANHLEEALQGNPPYNQFSCVMPVNEDFKPGRYRVRLSFRNVNGDTKEHTLSYSARNIDEALELKMAIQSHVLNHKHIEPMQFHGHNGSAKRVYTPDTYIPNKEPKSVTLGWPNKYYEAEFVFPEEEGKAEERVVIPLGVKHLVNDAVKDKEASDRLQCLETHLFELRKNGRWKTVGEVTQYLKNTVLKGRSASGLTFKGGWRVAESMPLGYFEELKAVAREKEHVTLYHVGEQTVTLKSAHLHEEDGNGSKNRTWRLELKIGVKGVSGEELEFEYGPTLNLHTIDATAAQSRGREALKSFVESYKKLETTYPDMRWKREGKDFAHLILSDSAGNKPANPDPQSLLQIQEDMPNPKNNYQARVSLGPIENEHIALTFHGVRGTEAENDLMDINNSEAEPLKRTYTIKSVGNMEANEKHAKEILGKINTTFKTYVDDRYGNQEKDGKRKQRGKFDIRTIENLFDEVLKERMGEVKAAEKASEDNSKDKKLPEASPGSDVLGSTVQPEAQNLENDKANAQNQQLGRVAPGKTKRYFRK